MNCQDVQSLIHPFVDGELDVVRQIEFEQHLVQCRDCRERVKRLQSLRTDLSSPTLRYEPSASLMARVTLAAPPIASQRRRRMDAVSARVTSLLLLSGIVAAIGFLLFHTGSSAEAQLAELVVAGHIRSLQAEHLTDVASSDRHTVKPWFQGKIDFAPKVIDLSDEGFILSGGRLDYLTDRSVAVLIYHRRRHVINVFMWPTTNDREISTQKLARNGYHLRQWQRSGMIYWAITDLNDAEFDDFVRLFQERI